MHWSYHALENLTQFLTYLLCKVSHKFFDTLIPDGGVGLWVKNSWEIAVLEICTYSALFCIPVLIPIAATSRNNEVQFQKNQNNTYEPFDNLAMGNIEVGR